MEDSLAILLGGPFYMDIDRLLNADMDELTWLLGLVRARGALEKANG